MKKIVLLVSTIVAVFAIAAYAQTVPADKMQINLQEAWPVKTKTQKGVVFNHETHLAKLNNKCDSCHSSAQGASKIALSGDIKGSGATNPAHKFCWSCHDKQPKPNKTPGKTCTKCHTAPKK